MGLFEVSLIGVGLAMDAASVAMTNGMVYKKLSMGNYISMPLLFGIFQGVMPLIGFYAGTLFAGIIMKYSGIVIFAILAIIGGNMIKESLSKESDAVEIKNLTMTILIFQAIATSIDAFAVGVGFCAICVDILPAVSIIAVITAFMVAGAIAVGKKFGDIFENKAEFLGGIILIIIGVKGLL
ncbi:putative sporulation protein YtaF [uncultured Eubacterium sp.]|nr:putative sporulation protein YtaF [uncultured Eubacterium sp.]